MIGNVVGVKPVHFTNTDTGEVVSGTSLYVNYDDLDVFGKACSVIWVASETPLDNKLLTYLSSIDKVGKPDSLLGCDVDFSFKPNSRKIAQFDIITKK